MRKTKTENTNAIATEPSAMIPKMSAAMFLSIPSCTRRRAVSNERARVIPRPNSPMPAAALHYR
jgi:hypothetical protein